MCRPGREALRPMKARLILVLSIAILAPMVCAYVLFHLVNTPTALASESQRRSARRAYDRAPPVIPHPRLGGACIHCHGDTGRELPGIGWAPPNPHLKTL